MVVRVAPTPAERTRALPGDDLVPQANVVMDRGFTLPGDPAEVWPWLQQLGKGRAGWYLPSRVERLLPRRNRALRHVEDEWQHLKVGDVVPDYGGASASFEVALVSPGHHLVYVSRRGSLRMSWCLSIAADPRSTGSTRAHLRFRIGPVRRRRLAEYGGGLMDLVTIAGLAAGLAERLDARRPQ